MERKMRRSDRALSEEEVQVLLEKGEFGVLSTVSKDGQPYGVPLSYAYTGTGICFHSAREGHKLDNISENARVSFCVVGKTEVMPEKFSTKYQSVIVFGKISEAFDDEKKQELSELLKKYSPGFIKEGLEYRETASAKTRVFKILVESMTGKARK
jgi:hypothetical protein